MRMMLVGRRALLVVAVLCVTSTLVLVAQEAALFTARAQPPTPVSLPLQAQVPNAPRKEGTAPIMMSVKQRMMNNNNVNGLEIINAPRRRDTIDDDDDDDDDADVALLRRSGKDDFTPLEQQLAEALVHQQKLLADQQLHLRELSELRQALVQHRQTLQLQQQQQRLDEMRTGGIQPSPPPSSATTTNVAPTTTGSTGGGNNNIRRVASTGRQLTPTMMMAPPITAVGGGGGGGLTPNPSYSQRAILHSTTTDSPPPPSPPPSTMAVSPSMMTPAMRQQQFLQQQQQQLRQRQLQQQQLQQQQQQQQIAARQQQAVTEQLDAKQRVQQVPVPPAPAVGRMVALVTPDGRELPVRVAKDPWNTANFEPYVMVIGMHRSLTSALVQALAETMNFRLASYYTGNWELSEMQVANDLLLQFSQSRWDHVNLPFDRPVSLPIPCVPQHTRHIQYLNVGENFTQEPRTGTLVLKDPRLCLTLPYWSQCLPKPPHVAFIFRSPIEVARSLEKRNSMPLRQGIELWYKYNKLALIHIANLNHTIIEAQALVDRPLETLEFLFKVLSHQWQLPRLMQPLNGGALDAKHTSSRPPLDRLDLQRQVSEALEPTIHINNNNNDNDYDLLDSRAPGTVAGGGGGDERVVTTFDVMELYDELIRRRFSIHTL